MFVSFDSSFANVERVRLPVVAIGQVGCQDLKLRQSNDNCVQNLGSVSLSPGLLKLSLQRFVYIGGCEPDGIPSYYR